MKDLIFQDCKLNELPSVVRKILDKYPDNRVFAFFGDLGAGKTTMIKAFCHELGVSGDVTSPSFSIINEYVVDGIDIIYHFDLYRIKKLEEIMDIGYEEYFYSGHYCFLEWADKIEALLPVTYVHLSITGGEHQNGRTIKTALIK